MLGILKSRRIKSMKKTYLKHGNKNGTDLFIACLSVACMSLSLVACGQSGALYIPKTPEAAQRSTIGDVLTKPASTTSPVPTLAPASPAPAQ
jgi:predicted small lipoprotein YifL